MILITLYRIDNKFNSLLVKGHANSDEYGKDIVCSAVSAVVIGGINSLKNPKDFDIEVKEGYVSLTAKKEISEYDEIVIKTMLTQLQSIEESEPKRIKINEKGK